MSKFWIAYIVPGLLLFAAVFATPATGAIKGARGQLRQVDRDQVVRGGERK